MSVAGKHVYIIPEVDRFFYLQVDYLINRVGIQPNDICAVFISNNLGVNVVGYPGVEYINSLSVDFDDFRFAKTVTTLSLSTYNSGFISNLIKVIPDVVDKFYLLITDDEVDRWNTVHKKYGKLKAVIKQHITQDDIYVLSKVKYFIGFELVFKATVERILNRNVHFIDTGCLFKILPLSQHSAVKENLQYDVNNDVKRVWFHTKPIGRISDFFRFAKALFTFYREFGNKVHFVVFSGGLKSSLLLNVIIMFVTCCYARKMKVDVVHPTDKYSYMMQLMACDFLILQRRGGCGTARVLMDAGRGMVCVLDHTENQIKLEKAYNISLIKGGDYSSLAKIIRTSEINLSKISASLLQMEAKYIERYRSVYR